MTVRVRRGTALWVGVATSALVVAPLATAPPLASADPSSSGPKGRYIVQVTGAPIASYNGSSSIKRTKPAKGKKVNRSSAAAKEYGAALKVKKNKVLSSVGVSTDAVTHDYKVTFNGFAAKLTQEQVAALRKSSSVVRVWKDEVRHQDTTTTPDFLGLSGKKGTWAKEFGGIKNAGRGMIIGVVDSGIWSDHPSFAPTGQTKAEAETIASKWKGTCDAGVEAPKVTCNNKLIGARYFRASGSVPTEDFASPRDFGGHGTHTASTSGGNANVKAEIYGDTVGKVSGIAPHARIAAYKALWGEAGTGATADLVSAIDAAVGDGVDVINYSVSGSRTAVVSPDELAFLGAADAGVFVATSAGNDGTDIGPSSVAHNSPWTTTVASSTHDRGAAKTITLGNGKKYEGVGVRKAVPSSPIVNAEDVSVKGAPELLASQCQTDVDPDKAGAQPALDPAKVKGKIVVCTRGGNDRVVKSDAVNAAGGVGMVLVNTDPAESLDADYHVIPTIQVTPANGKPIKAYASKKKSTAAISAADESTVRAPAMSGFSSYGPALAGGGDLLKPDITAPGSNVIAGVAPPGNSDNLFGSYSGTSMSAPHIAGIAAMVMQKNPTWSPAAVKSAMMTTATTKDNEGKQIQRGDKDATPLDYGAGHVQVSKAFKPGLVYDAGYSDWLKYACGLGQLQLVTSEETCDVVGSTDSSDLNYPSIAVGDLVDSQTVKRTVTNVEKKAATYTAKVDAPAGVSVTVTPRTLKVPAGQSRSFEVTMRRTTATLDEYAFGQLTWNGNRGQSVQSPIAVQPLSVRAPLSINGTTTSGSRAMEVTTGYAGPLNTTVHGLTPSTVTSKEATTAKPAVFTVKVPKGTSVVRFATYDEDYAEGTDLDVVLKKDGAVVAESAGATADESMTFEGLEAGTYTAEVVIFSGAASMPVRLNSFLVMPKAAGNLTVDPAALQAKLAKPFTMTAKWSGLEAGKRYLGVIRYDNGTPDLDKKTVVSIDTTKASS